VAAKQPRRSGRNSTVRSTLARGRGLKTDWKRVDKMADAEIRRGIRSDSDAAPELDASWFRNARIVIPERKQALSIRLDRDVMEWFRRQGRGYQTRINAVLRAYVEAHQQS
jgi:uncharacterized protein (DUF4415 family)